MTRVLISVRSVAECRVVLSAGADVIDIKEPSRGSLGRPAEHVIQQITALVGTQRPVSVAMGELLDCSAQSLRKLPAELTYAKLGLAGCNKRGDWRELWWQACTLLPKSTERVAVVYADRERAESPEWREVLDQATHMGCRVLLVDTFDKTGGNLLHHFEPAALLSLITTARDCGLRVALAGSLDLSCLPEILPLRPDWIAVRGAVCRQGREGGIDPIAVSEFLKTVRASSQIACRL